MKPVCGECTTTTESIGVCSRDYCNTLGFFLGGGGGRGGDRDSEKGEKETAVCQFIKCSETPAPTKANCQKAVRRK